MDPIAPEVLDRLRQAALDAAQNAYAPYSQFYVGAALLFDDGQMVTGCNVENVSYGLTSCAERNALFRAVSECGPGRRITAIAVANRRGAPCPPCGACRQVMSEFVTSDAIITFPGEDGPQTLAFAAIFPSRFRFTPGADPAQV
jgi:cytidine deaminase